jgi:hypothetical protein
MYLVSNIKYNYFSSYRLAEYTVSLRKLAEYTVSLRKFRYFQTLIIFFKYFTTINKSGVTE